MGEDSIIGRVRGEALTTKNLLVLSALVTILGVVAGGVNFVLSGIYESQVARLEAAQIARDESHQAEIERLDANHQAELDRLQTEMGARVLEWKALYDEARSDFRDSLRLMHESVTLQGEGRDDDP